MHKPQEQVRDFHRACNLLNPELVDVFDRPRVLDDWIQNREDTRLRLDLIWEEFHETQDAVNTKDLEGVIDGLCDMLYVIYGMAVSMGVDLEPFFEEVHRANMSKAGGPKREDGKQLKPVGWQPPRIDLIMAREGLVYL